MSDSTFIRTGCRPRTDGESRRREGERRRRHATEPPGPRGERGAYRPEQHRERDDNLNRFCSEILGEGQRRPPAVRNWQSSGAGHVYSPQGPAAEIAMAPAPTLCSSELSAEMAEVYAAALIRDEPFADFGTSARVRQVLACLNRLAWFAADGEPVSAGGCKRLNPQEHARRAARFATGRGPLTAADLLRGSAPGAKDGPFVSQFMLIGNAARGSAPAPRPAAQDALGQASHAEASARVLPTRSAGSEAGELTLADSLIRYGVQSIRQKIVPHQPGRDYLCEWGLWLNVQNGADVRGADAYGGERFITTPRDLASYVHFDQLYQAYLNACLLLLAYSTPFNRGFPGDAHRPGREPSASFGGPYVLSLLTEAATRALKAVQRQKSPHHLRARPEVLGAMLSLVANGRADALGTEAGRTLKDRMLPELTDSGLLALVHRHNLAQRRKTADESADEAARWRLGGRAPDPLTQHNYLLPMAFPEGSPMHPSYGAGHATVAGACVTVLKAFFELYAPPQGAVDFLDDAWWQRKLTLADINIPQVFESRDGEALYPVEGRGADRISVAGELNKLAANISIGRNMAGVHYYSDYFDSLRMGERVAAGLMREQLGGCPESVSMRFESFDGSRVVLSNDPRYGGSQQCPVINVDGEIDDKARWWNRHLP